MTNIYETTIIVKPDLANDQMKSLNNSIDQFFSENDVSIGYKEDWGIKNLKSSKRNELEITSVNNILLKKGYLNFQRIGRATTWFDLGSFENIYQCSEFVRLIEKRQGLKIADI